jgi:hypothetical protein
MKSNIRYITLVIFCVAAFSCKKDNYEEPKSTLSGKFHYRGEPIQVEYDRVPFELYEYGFGKVGPINATITQEGTYSHVLFDGDYKLVVRAGQGPFLWPQTGGKSDSISITVKGNTTQDIEVMPYYMVRSPKFTSTGRNITATFATEKIITNANARDIERVNLYVNKTQFVSSTDNIASRAYAQDAITNPANIEFNKFIPVQTLTQNYFFARVGIKIAGVEDMIFSPVQRVEVSTIEGFTRIEAEAGTPVGGAVVFTEPPGTALRKWIENIAAAGSGVDISYNAATAGSYMINIGGGTDVNGSTHTVYIDGNLASAKTVTYPKQDRSTFDIAPVTFDLSAGQHTISIRKNANNTGQAQIDWVEVYKYR